MAWLASLIGVGSIVGFGNWRNGILYLLVIGFLQDPIRKILPDVPVYTQIMVVVFLGILVLCAKQQNVRVRLSVIHGGDHRLGRAWNLFIFLVVVQCAHTYLWYGSSVLAGLGLINYLVPVAALMLGVEFADDPGWIDRFLRTYLWLAIPIGLTVYLSFYFQNDWDVLKSIGRLHGTPLLIFDKGVHQLLYSNSGIMRVGEIAAWHAGTAVMLLIMFATTDRRFRFRLLAGVAGMLLLGAIVLTGRRKMLMAIAIFLAVFVLLLMLYWQKVNKIGTLIVILSVATVVYVWLQPEQRESIYYAERGVSVFGDATTRLARAWDLLEWGYYRGGMFGLGAGVSAQGAEHFGGALTGVGGVAEAGGGKVVVELGVAGLVVIMYLLWRLFRHFHEFFRLVPAHYEHLAVLLSGITALIIANAATFFVATQVFGDPFVLILMGFFVSFLFALERFARGI